MTVTSNHHAHFGSARLPMLDGSLGLVGLLLLVFVTTADAVPPMYDILSSGATATTTTTTPIPIKKSKTKKKVTTTSSSSAAGVAPEISVDAATLAAATAGGPAPRVGSLDDPRQLQQQEQQQDGGESTIYHTARLRRDLLTDYDRGAYPWEDTWESSLQASSSTDNNPNPNGLRTGLAVELGINFHKVFEVDVTLSRVDLIVWLRQRWYDPRLVWDPAQYGNLTKTFFWVGDGSGPGGETSEIWTPDLELWNLEDSLSDSLTDAHLVVFSDGSVFWSRPGHLKPVCRWEGFHNFPFDTLGCTMEIGSWAYSGLYLRPIKLDGTGFTIGGSQTAGPAYAEYILESVTAEEFTYPPFVNSPEEDWPVIFYDIKFSRASKPYERGFLALQIILNLVAFASFWLPPHCGERMGLNITAMLAAVASELVISENLPNTREITWFSRFSLGSLMFASFALFESAIVIFFFYYAGDDLVPSYIKWAQQKWRERRENGPSSSSSTRKGRKLSAMMDDDGITEQDEYVATHLVQEQLEQLDSSGEEQEQKSRNKNNNSSHVRFDEAGEEDGRLDESMMTDGDESDRPRARGRGGGGGHRRSSLLEYKSSLSGSTRSGIKAMLGRDADDFRSAKEVENNARWHQWAVNIDEASRVLFPVGFSVFLAVLFAKT